MSMMCKIILQKAVNNFNKTHALIFLKCRYTACNVFWHYSGTRKVKNNYKMRLKHIITIFIFGILAGNTLNAQQKWSLNQCISYAIENNVNLKEYEIREKLSIEDYNQSKRNLLPGVSASSSGGLNFGRSVDETTYEYVDNKEYFSSSHSIGASITLFDGFSLQNRIKYEKFRKQASTFNRLNAIDDLAFSVMTAYFDVIYYKGMLSIAEEQVETSRMNLNVTEKQVEVGRKAKSDILEMRANLEMEELRRIQMENSLRTAMLQLKQHMNLITDENLELAEESSPVVLKSFPDKENMFSAFLGWSPYYQSIVFNHKAMEKNLALSRAKLYPSLSAGGLIRTGFSENTTDNNGNTIKFGDQTRINKSQNLAVSIDIPIFSRWANRSNIKKAKLEVERAKNQMEGEKQKLYFDMVNNLNDLDALGKEYTQYEKQMEVDQLAFQATEKKFEQGLISVIDFYISKNRLANSNSQVLRAKLQLEIKKKTIEFYQGQRFWENQ